MTKSQTQVIRERLERGLLVSNLWAFQHQIWRLASRIRDCREAGMNIETIYRNSKGERNSRYILVK